MTALDLLALTGYGVATVLLGRAALSLFPRADRRRGGLLSGWAPALLAGQSVLAAAALATGLIPVSLPAVGIVLAALATALASVLGIRARVDLRRRQPLRIPSPELRWALLGAGLVALLYPDVVFWILHRPVVDWDARSIWLFHARVLYVDRALDPSLFTDPVYLHSDYPLFLPAQAAWLSLLRGAWSEVGAKSFLLLDFAAYFQLLLTLLRAKGYPWWLGLGAALLFFDVSVRTYSNGFGSAYVNGYADAHYIAPFLLALLAFSLPRRTGGSALGVLLLAYGANVKAESGLYALLLAAVAAAIAAGIAVRNTVAGRPIRRSGSPDGARLGRRRERGHRERGRRVLAGLALGGVPMALWTVFRALHGIGSDIHPLRWLTDLPGVAVLARERGGEIALYFRDFFVDSGAPWLLALWIALLAVRAAWVVSGRRRDRGPRRVELAGTLVAAALLPVIFSMYVVSPLELGVHLRTSADRLLFLPLSLLYGLVLIALGALLPGRPSRPQLGAGSPLAATSLISAKTLPSVS